jgi:transketolase
MELPVIYVFTHDSIGVGEDGPTHQPIEQLAHMRSTAGLIMIRPADANEVTEAWKVILRLHHEPAVLVLTRQAVPTIDRKKYAALARGAYVLADAPGAAPQVILIGTGCEVALCLQAYEQLNNEGVRARVVSMPSWECSTTRTATTETPLGRTSRPWRDSSVVLSHLAGMRLH